MISKAILCAAIMLVPVAATADEARDAVLKKAKPILRSISERDFPERCTPNGHIIPSGSSERPDEIRCIRDGHVTAWRRTTLLNGTTADVITVGIEDGDRMRRMMTYVERVNETNASSTIEIVGIPSIGPDVADDEIDGLVAALEQILAR
jgi:hypothetical protein